MVAPRAPGSLAGRRVLVTGGSGFIGRHLLARLIQLDAAVTTVSRRERQIGEVVWHTADLTELKETRSLVREARPDLVFHLAGYPVGSRLLEHVLPSFRANLLTTVNLLHTLAETPCTRLVIAGSLEESDTTTPSSPYAAAKSAARDYALMFHALYDLPVVHTRIFMVYGPGLQDEGKLIPYVIRQLLGGRPPELSSGQREVDWIYVTDVVEGLLAAALAPDIEGQSVDIGTGTLTSVRDVVAQIAAAVESGVELRFGALGDRPHEQVRVADAARAERLVGWRAETSLGAGLRQTVAWFAANAAER